MTMGMHFAVIVAEFRLAWWQQEGTRFSSLDELNLQRIFSYADYT